MSETSKLRAEIASLREEIAELRKQLGGRLPAPVHACCLHTHWCAHHVTCCCGSTRVCPVHGYGGWYVSSISAGSTIYPTVTTNVASGATNMYTISNVSGYTSSGGSESN